MTMGTRHGNFFGFQHDVTRFGFTKEREPPGAVKFLMPEPTGEIRSDVVIVEFFRLVQIRRLKDAANGLNGRSVLRIGQCSSHFLGGSP